MNSCVQSVETAVKRTLGESSGRRFIVGLSGGADSVALLAAMCATGYDCVAAHCNFGLRGDESERDAAHAAEIARIIGVKIENKRMDVGKWRAQHGGSVEMACRDLRYRWFDELIKRYDAEGVAVAHHRDDNTETFFLNLLRGTGLSGLVGMKSVVRQPVPVVRPFLEVSRKEILCYLDAKGLAFVIDSSNLGNDFVRNRIRNAVLPALMSQFPEADRSIALTMSHLREANELIAETIAGYRKRYMSEAGEVNVKALVKECHSCGFVLYEMLKDHGFSRRQTDDILVAVAEGHSGRRFETDTVTWLLDRGVLRRYNLMVDKKKETDSPHRLGPFIIKVVKGERIVPSSEVAYFSTDVLCGEPLMCRYWQIGDRIKPFGMKGSRKLSDIFSDAKIAEDMKHRIPLLVKGEEILWVGGLRHSRCYSVAPHEEEMVRIVLSKEL